MKTIFLISNMMFLIAFASLVIAVACSVSQIPCADDTCNETSCINHDGKRTGSCNNNGICESGEECGCKDCVLEHVSSSCSTDLLCSSSGFCMENCTTLEDEFTLTDIFSFTKEIPAAADVHVHNFDYWILDEYGNLQQVEVSIKSW
ncbi:hypothetical protein KY312_01470 [Candidatus Woesearchaeota archaeon]|nr:hypothetical protein [Candidatus Woesearchaeota archaeon]